MLEKMKELDLTWTGLECEGYTYGESLCLWCSVCSRVSPQDPIKTYSLPPMMIQGFFQLKDQPEESATSK